MSLHSLIESLIRHTSFRTEAEHNQALADLAALKKEAGEAVTEADPAPTTPLPEPPKAV